MSEPTVAAAALRVLFHISELGLVVWGQGTGSRSLLEAQTASFPAALPVLTVALRVSPVTVGEGICDVTMRILMLSLSRQLHLSLQGG